MRKSILSAYAIAAVGMIGGMTGCASHNNETPLTTNFPTTRQFKLQSGAHWEIIANAVAERMKNNKEIDGTALSILPPVPNSEFTKAFRNQLISALVNKGFPVTKNNDGKGNIVEIETQLVKFSPTRYQNHYFISSKSLAAGVWGVHGLETPPKTIVNSGTLATNATIDWNQWADQEFTKGVTPQYEVIVTTSISKGAMYVGRTTDVYYIADTDNTLYGKNPGVKFKISGDDK